MYWNNPLIELQWPSAQDPIRDSLHGGKHCLFYNPAFPLDILGSNRPLEELCRWGNEWMFYDGIERFAEFTDNHFDMANFVKINILLHDMKRQGIVKPCLILDEGNGSYITGNGETRLRALERMPEITAIPAFISTTSDRKHLYADLQEIETFDQLAKICKSVPEQKFIFRLTDPDAPYGLYWYEYDSPLTKTVTLDTERCVTQFINYVKQHSDIVFSPEWFDQHIDWAQFI